jgi:hypothetical protein
VRSFPCTPTAEITMHTFWSCHPYASAGLLLSPPPYPKKIMTIQKFKWLLAGSSHRRPGTKASVCPIYLMRVVNKVTQGWNFPHHLRFLLPIINPTIFYIHLSWNAGTLEQSWDCSNKGFRLPLLLPIKVTNFTEKLLIAPVLDKFPSFYESLRLIIIPTRGPQ